VIAGEILVTGATGPTGPGWDWAVCNSFTTVATWVERAKGA